MSTLTRQAPAQVPTPQQRSTLAPLTQGGAVGNTYFVSADANVGPSGGSGQQVFASAVGVGGGTATYSTYLNRPVILLSAPPTTGRILLAPSTVIAPTKLLAGYWAYAPEIRFMVSMARDAAGGQAGPGSGFFMGMIQGVGDPPGAGDRKRGTWAVTGDTAGGWQYTSCDNAGALLEAVPLTLPVPVTEFCTFEFRILPPTLSSDAALELWVGGARVLSRPFNTALLPIISAGAGVSGIQCCLCQFATAVTLPNLAIADMALQVG